MYSAALRRLNGRTDLAEEVAQQVFADLALKAGSISSGTVLGGWLHRHTGFLAANAVRAEARRLQREQEACSMNDHPDAPATLLDQLGPVLDGALDELPAADRDALVLRYLERRDLRSVGARLGLSDDAAQKRVARALEKLRVLLARRGCAVPVLTLGALLTQAASVTAPAALATAFAGTALTAATTATATSAIPLGAKALLPVFLMRKAKIALLTVVAVGVSTPVVIQQRQIKQLTSANEQVGAQLASLRRERDELNAKLERIRGEEAIDRADVNELARLRGNAGRMRAEIDALKTTNALLAANLNKASAAASAKTRSAGTKELVASVPLNRQMRPDGFQNAGFSTPESAFSSVMWALQSGAHANYQWATSGGMRTNFTNLDGVSQSLFESMRAATGIELVKQETFSDGTVGYDFKLDYGQLDLDAARKQAQHLGSYPVEGSMQFRQTNGVWAISRTSYSTARNTVGNVKELSDQQFFDQLIQQVRDGKATIVPVPQKQP